MFERLITLITEEQLKLIIKTKVLLVGVGGVGGNALEALVRSGFSDITIIDGDTFNLSNLNRQILSNRDNLGLSKVSEAILRAKSINPDINIRGIDKFLTCDNFSSIINEKYDFIIDACDDTLIKIELIKYAKDNNIKIITCLGTGKRIDATKLIVTTLNKTFNDPLAKRLRHELKKQDISLNIPVVFSSEEASDTKNVIGSAIFVPATAGILLANYVFMDVIKKQD